MKESLSDENSRSNQVEKIFYFHKIIMDDAKQLANIK